MGKSRSKLAADWFASLRTNTTTGEVEHETDIALAESIASIPPSTDASALTTGTLPDGRFPTVLPAIDGSALTNMPGGASAFNQNLSTWDVSGVTTMARMFENAALFNQDISSWITNSVTAMDDMFKGASSFNQDLSSWNVENIGSRPSGFDSGASNWILPKPRWGTTGA